MTFSHSGMTRTWNVTLFYYLSTMVDSLLSLLVKAHARLQWSRMATSTDPQAQQAAAPTCTSGPAVAQDCAFLTFPSVSSKTPSSSASPSVTDLSARCMAVLNATNVEEIGEGSSGTVTSPLARALQVGNIGGTPEEKMVKVLTEMAPELRYFAVAAPAYKLPATKIVEEENVNSQSEDKPIECGDGAYWVQRLLDKIVELSPECETQLKVFLDRACDPFDMKQQETESMNEDTDKYVRVIVLIAKVAMPFLFFCINSYKVALLDSLI